VVSRGRGASREAGRVGRASHGNHLAFVVHEEHGDVDGAFVIDTVLDKVLAIVVVIELVGHFLTVVSLDGDLELITTGLAVLAFIVTGLNDEFNRLTNGLIF